MHEIAAGEKKNKSQQANFLCTMHNAEVYTFCSGFIKLCDCVA